MTVASAEPLFKGSSARNSRGLLRLTILLTIAAAAVASRLFSVISAYFMMSTPEPEPSVPELCKSQHTSPTEPFYKMEPGLTMIDRIREYHSRMFVQPSNVPRTILWATRVEADGFIVDPWFNFRATKYLVSNGFYDFWDWFDDRTWHPLGRVTGGTLYPGLMVTSGIIYHTLRNLSMPIDIRNICVLLAPAFSGLTAYATYLFTNEMSDSPSAGLLAAIFMGIAPGYISRSVAGSYDNEAIAIFLLVYTFYLWIKAVKLGSAFWGALCALFYGYMVSAWGGYVFITNLIPLHVFVLIAMGRFSPRVYVGYTTWYALGTLASMQIPFVGFLPVRSSEHMSALGVFGLLQLVGFVEFVRAGVPSKQFQTLLRGFVLAVFVIALGGLVLLTVSGVIAPWTGRFYSLWDTGYAKIHIPIIASVSEHQPTAWPAFFFDLNLLIWLFPAGVYLCFLKLTDEQVFIVVYAILASYFAGVMVRLMLTLTPIVCVAAAMICSSILDSYLTMASPKSDDASVAAAADAANNGTASGKKGKDSLRSMSKPFVGVYTWLSKGTVVGAMTCYLLIFVLHCTWVTSNAYSSPSVVLASKLPDGSQHIIDDYREAYQWLRQNTKEDAKIMSWWDYGYQIGGMADRPTLVDNNTWNNTHIATVGKAMSSREEVSYPIMKQHEVDYVLVVFGGLLGYSGDDINKFLWMVRIAEGIWPDEVKERDFFTARGEYRVDDGATETMKNSLMYKMSYYNYNTLFPPGQAQDRVRGVKLPDQGPVLNTVEEVFTSENWIIRLYKVKDLDNVGRDHAAAASFERGNKKKKAAKRRGPKVLRVD
ncbi:MAG: oligosaccharyl transferase stt3 subunit [Claussenomyces sp. TS43310]|nr:MAG: oligosaccharyl transferase stt3 subunit [Claussenomyces sp. TS43310]